jgi:WD40 repeat protein
MRILRTNRTRPVTGLGIALNGSTLVAGGPGGFDVHDLTTGDGTSFDIPHSTDVFDIALDPVGRWLYFSSMGAGGCWIYHLKTGEKRRFGGDPDDHHVVSIAVSVDGTRVALSRGGGTNNRLECWAISADDKLSLAWSARAERWCMHHGLAFALDGRVVGIEDSLASRPLNIQQFFRFPTEHQVVVRDGINGHPLLTLGRVPQTLGLRATFSGRGNEYVLWDDRGVHFFSLNEPAPPRTRRHPGSAHFRGVAFHPSGRFFVTVANDGVARYWDLATLNQTQAFKWKAGKLQSLALSPDGTLAAAGTDKGQVVLWDVDV